MARVCPDLACRSESIIDIDDGGFMCEECGKEMTEADFKYQGYKIGEQRGDPGKVVHVDAQQGGGETSARCSQSGTCAYESGYLVAWTTPLD